MTQLTLANQPYVTKKKKTKREQFLKEMDQALPWKELLRIVNRRYYKEGDNGRPKMPAERMLRVSRKAKPGQPLSRRDKLWNRAQSRVRELSETIPFMFLNAFGVIPRFVIEDSLKIPVSSFPSVPWPMSLGSGTGLQPLRFLPTERGTF